MTPNFFVYNLLILKIPVYWPKFKQVHKIKNVDRNQQLEIHLFFTHVDIF